MKPTLTITAVVCLALVGCSRDENAERTAPKAEPKPKPVVDSRPRVDGRWRVVYRPADYTGQTTRATWRITPACSAGPCGFLVRSSTKTKFRYRFDDAIGDYTFTEHPYRSCQNGSGRVLVKRGYAVSRQVNLRVTASTASGVGRTATRMKGTDSSLLRTTKKAGLAGCSDAPKETDRVIAVRLAP